jgi:hypothetical protein
MPTVREPVSLPACGQDLIVRRIGFEQGARSHVSDILSLR